jgi:hypothetical protein
MKERNKTRAKRKTMIIQKTDTRNVGKYMKMAMS